MPPLSSSLVVLAIFDCFPDAFDNLLHIKGFQSTKGSLQTHEFHYGCPVDAHHEVSATRLFRIDCYGCGRAAATSFLHSLKDLGGACFECGSLLASLNCYCDCDSIITSGFGASLCRKFFGLDSQLVRNYDRLFSCRRYLSFLCGHR